MNPITPEKVWLTIEHLTGRVISADRSYLEAVRYPTSDTYIVGPYEIEKKTTAEEPTRQELEIAAIELALDSSRSISSHKDWHKYLSTLECELNQYLSILTPDHELEAKSELTDFQFEYLMSELAAYDHYYSR